MFDRNLRTVCVPVDQLKIGMYVSRLDRPWLGTPFLLQGFQIETQQDIQLLMETCEYIYIDVRESKIDHTMVERHTLADARWTTKQAHSAVNNRYVGPAIKYQGKQVYANKYTAEQELQRAGRAYNHTKRTVDDILDNFKQGREINLSQAKVVINECVESIFNNKDSLLWFTLIKNQDHYTSEHCLNVAILSIAFGRFLGHSEKTLKTIGLCGLLHDVGKVSIPLEVLNKEGIFTNEEFEIMKQHPTLGRDYLVNQPHALPEAIDATYSHHEKIDGSGYPQGLLGSQIPYFAKLVAITDAYDAITSDRVYQQGRTTLQAQKILYQAAGSHFDQDLTKSFIQWLGIYPPGSIVEMTNGEAGIVLSVNPDWKTKPRVALLVDQDKSPCAQRIVDLYKNDLDFQGEKYVIKYSHPNNTFGINLRTFQASNEIS